jgi:hypothetical protein
MFRSNTALPTTRLRTAGVTALVSLSMLALAGCGAATSAAPSATSHTGRNALGVGAGARLFYESEDNGHHREMTVALDEVEPRLAFELACEHVAAGTPLSHPTTGSVNRRALSQGREIYSLANCDGVHERDGDALPLFTLSHDVASGLARNERMIVRREHQTTDVALLPIGRERIDVEVDGRHVAVDAVHATMEGGGLELWVVPGETPIVVRMRESGRVVTLAAVDTGRS